MSGAAKTRQFLSGWAREQLGFVTSWENEAGALLSLESYGRVKDALPDVIARALKADRSNRLVSYSTVDTILTDVQGLRRSARRPSFFPEQRALELVGRGDLLHPRLARRTSRDRRIDRW